MSWMEDAPRFDFYRTSFHVANKEHICVLCKQSILPGQRYKKVVMKEDTGEVETYKEHDKLCLHA